MKTNIGDKLFSDNPHFNNFCLATDSQEIADTFEMLEVENGDASALLIKTGDGDYKEVWATESSKPYLAVNPYTRIA